MAKHTLQFEVDFEVGEVVWHRNGESDKGLVIGYRVSGSDVLYDVCWGRERCCDHHLDIELSPEPIIMFGLPGDSDDIQKDDEE
jgi:hypothetical protein